MDTQRRQPCDISKHSSSMKVYNTSQQVNQYLRVSEIWITNQTMDSGSQFEIQPGELQLVEGKLPKK